MTCSTRLTSNQYGIQPTADPSIKSTIRPLSDSRESKWYVTKRGVKTNRYPITRCAYTSRRLSRVLTGSAQRGQCKWRVAIVIRRGSLEARTAAINTFESVRRRFAVNACVDLDLPRRGPFVGQPIVAPINYVIKTPTDDMMTNESHVLYRYCFNFITQPRFKRRYTIHFLGKTFVSICIVYFSYPIWKSRISHIIESYSSQSQSQNLQSLFDV